MINNDIRRPTKAEALSAVFGSSTRWTTYKKDAIYIRVKKVLKILIRLGFHSILLNNNPS